MCNSADGCRQQYISPFFALSKHPSKNSWVCICMHACALSVKSNPPCTKGTALQCPSLRQTKKATSCSTQEHAPRQESANAGSWDAAHMQRCMIVPSFTPTKFKGISRSFKVQHSQHSALEALRTNQCHVQRRRPLCVALSVQEQRDT